VVEPVNLHDDALAVMVALVDTDVRDPRGENLPDDDMPYSDCLVTSILIELRDTPFINRVYFQTVDGVALWSGMIQALSTGISWTPDVFLRDLAWGIEW
jgi:hypothetical protein